jgi:hypothetical protein
MDLVKKAVLKIESKINLAGQIIESHSCRLQRERQDAQAESSQKALSVAPKRDHAPDHQSLLVVEDLNERPAE